MFLSLPHFRRRCALRCLQAVQWCLAPRLPQADQAVLQCQLPPLGVPPHAPAAWLPIPLRACYCPWGAREGLEHLPCCTSKLLQCGAAMHCACSRLHFTGRQHEHKTAGVSRSQQRNSLTAFATKSFNLTP